ncbi:hypothetical protein ACSTJM_00190, partial [Vibrio parahaemolyticus]
RIMQYQSRYRSRAIQAAMRAYADTGFLDRSEQGSTAVTQINDEMRRISAIEHTRYASGQFISVKAGDCFAGLARHAGEPDPDPDFAACDPRQPCFLLGAVSTGNQGEGGHDQRSREWRWCCVIP